MVLIYLLLVLLTGSCAAPHRYMDGAPVRAPVVEPITTYTPRGAGLPEYWGAPEGPERSPHKRVLPETPDTRRVPGIWAGDEPAGVTLDVLGVPIYLPSDAEPDAVASAQKCGEGTRAALSSEEMRSFFARSGEDMRQCHVFLRWRRCMSAELWPESFRRAAAPAAKAARTERDCTSWEIAVSHDLPRFLWNLAKWHNETQRSSE